MPRRTGPADTASVLPEFPSGSQSGKRERSPAWERGSHSGGNCNGHQKRESIQILSGHCFPELNVRETPRQGEGSNASSQRRQVYKRDEDSDYGADAVDQQQVARSLAPERSGAHRAVPGIIGVNSRERASGNEYCSRDDDPNEEAPTGHHIKP